MIATLLLGAAMADAAPAPIVSIPELVDRRAELRGQIVEVHALMGPCRPLGCILYADEAALRLGQGSADHRNWLSIGSVGRAFDAKAMRLHGQAVSVRGRFDDSCFSHDMICLDRVAELQPADANSLMRLKDN